MGNAGNAGDVQPQGTFGSVPYTYRIGKYEVTNAQYVDFLNHVDPTGTNELGLYDNLMAGLVRGGIIYNSFAADGCQVRRQTRPGR